MFCTQQSHMSDFEKICYFVADNLHKFNSSYISFGTRFPSGTKLTIPCFNGHEIMYNQNGIMIADDTGYTYLTLSLNQHAYRNMSYVDLVDEEMCIKTTRDLTVVVNEYVYNHDSGVIQSIETGEKYGVDQFEELHFSLSTVFESLRSYPEMIEEINIFNAIRSKMTFFGTFYFEANSTDTSKLSDLIRILY